MILYGTVVWHGVEWHGVGDMVGYGTVWSGTAVLYFVTGHNLVTRHEKLGAAGK